MDNQQIRLLVVEDSPSLGEALKFAFGFEDGIEPVGVAPSIRQALEMAAAERPDVVLMDVRLPDGNGIEAVSRVVELRPGTYEIDATRRPRWIDFRIRGTSRFSKAIYDWDGGRLRVCQDSGGTGHRPATFDPPTGGRFVLERH